MFIAGLGTAAPPDRYTQLQCFEVLQASEQFARLNARSRAILRKVLLGDSGIDTRHFALRPLEDAFDLTPDTLSSRFAKHAPVLAAQAAARALEDARCEAGDIDALLVSTCTGYLCPGLTSYVSERLDLRPDVLALDLVGQGCAAALPNWRTAEALLAGGRSRRALSICVEVCSAALYFDDDPGVLVSACLFGDGAGAAVLSNEPPADRRRVEWKTAMSVLDPAQRDCLRFDQRNGMLRNVLSLQVPAVAAHAIEKVLTRALAQAGVLRAQVQGWVIHAGGRDVLAAVRRQLGLSAEDLRWSAAVLREFGNTSSSSVIFTLQRALADGARPGWWWLASFGAGFTCQGALLQVE